jgi:uncharacterized membrane protein
MVKRFKIADSMQQIVGGFLLAGPFVVTAEVWELAAAMNSVNTAILGFITMSIGYGALYKADRGRDIRKERKIIGVPLRFISLMIVSTASVCILVYLYSVPQAFEVGNLTLVKSVVMISLFSTIGAATADSIFPTPGAKDSKDASKPAVEKPN